jgi:hypothetical protein
MQVKGLDLPEPHSPVLDMIGSPGINFHKIPVEFPLEFDHGIHQVIFTVFPVVKMSPGGYGGAVDFLSAKVSVDPLFVTEF